MSNPSIFSSPAFQVDPMEQKRPGFNLVNQISSFNAIFDIKPLDQIESSRIDELLLDNFQPGMAVEERVVTDAEKLKSITADIKAIGRQGTVLIGERVYMAKEILKPYRDGTFTKWLEATFGTRKTGYNMLSYYELFQALPQPDLKERFKKIPQRVAYILASRCGDIEKKAEIIRNSHEMKPEELMILIQETFPASFIDKRKKKDDNLKTIIEIRNAINKLHKIKYYLTEHNKNELYKLRVLLDSIISNR